ncbi:MAG: hypothetical protein VKK42_23720 [Lyngbya sp.]|nr:hypothetical protein [Lyngbya sp.]
MENNTVQIGTNLNGINDWSTQYPFMDYFKSSRDWITHGSRTWNTNENNQLDLDEKGWVKSLDGGEFTSVGTMLPNDDQGRRFVVLYDGEGTIEYLLGADKDEAASQPGRDIFYAPPGAKLNLRITETDPNNTGDYIRNIRVIPEEYIDTYESQTFNPDFLESLEGYKVLRFMDWMDTNGSQQKQWSERPEVDDADYFGEGVPVEILVELANETGIDPWFTLPHEATDEYVRNFAEYVKDNLDPNLNVYVEFSNEVWNYMFSQANYVLDQGKQEFADLNIGDGQKARYWFGKRTSEITQIWDDVFANEKERVIGVLGAQAGNSWTAAKSLEYIESTGLSEEQAGIDAIAIAPYFGYYIGGRDFETEVESWTNDPDGGLNKLFQELTEGGVLDNGPEGGALQQSFDRMQKYVDLAEKEGLDLIAYEGGQHLSGTRGVENNQAITDLFITANRDPRMGELYTKYFEKWTELGGGLFANFSDVGTPSKWGSWGVRESIYQESSPKFDAIKEFLTADSSPDHSNPDDSNPTDDPVVDDPDVDDDDSPDEGDDFTSESDDTTTEVPDDSTSDSTSESIVIEAEDLELTGYKIESVKGSGASGGQNLTVEGAPNRSGTASGTFEGEAGTYRVELSYFDENDGVSSVTVTIAGESSSFDFDEDLPSFGATPQSLTGRVTHEVVQLQPGDSFEISGTGRQGERARIDSIKFTPIELASAQSDPLTGEPLESASDASIESNLILEDDAFEQLILNPNSESLWVSDFVDDQNVFELAGDLTFEQLEFVQSGDNTLIQIAQTDQLLATLEGVSATSLDSQDFAVREVF